jgi:hypothetical protein
MIEKTADLFTCTVKIRIERAPAGADAPQNREVALRLFLFAHFGRSIPCATGLLAIGLGLCGGHVSCENWACEGKCEGHCKSRNKNFHDVFSLTLTHRLRVAPPSSVIGPCRANLRLSRNLRLSLAYCPGLNGSSNSEKASMWEVFSRPCSSHNRIAKARVRWTDRLE